MQELAENDTGGLQDAVSKGNAGTESQHLAAFGHTRYLARFANILDRENQQAVDDAEVLFAELLPGWNWGRAFDGVFWVSRGRTEYRAGHDIPAYAFLLVTLKAVENSHV